MEKDILHERAVDPASVKDVAAIGEVTPQQLKQCYQCGQDNANLTFCGACGSPLNLNDYISKKVKDQLAETIQNRDVLERESSIKVFNQAWGWIKLFGGIAIGILVLTGAGIVWKASDFWSEVDKAKKSVTDTAKKSSDEITASSSQATKDISKELDEGKKAIKRALDEANQQTQGLEQTMLQVQAEIDSSRTELQAAGKIQSEVEDMRKQLAQATSDIQAQQKVLSSSEEFVKSVFSSHVVETFNIGQPPEGRYAVVPPPTKEIKRTVVWLLLDAAPIQGTLQLQFHISVQPRDSYVRIAHNLIVFFWGDPAERLQTRPLNVSYFPDKSDKEIIHSLSERDGRVFADNEQEHSVILTLLVGAADTARIPDRTCRYTWRSEAPTSHCCWPHTTRLQSA